MLEYSDETNVSDFIIIFINKFGNNNKLMKNTSHTNDVNSICNNRLIND